MPALIDHGSVGPPIDIGEPLDADSDESQAPATAQTAPVEFGEPLDADDAFTQELDLTNQYPTEIGSDLDADDPDPFEFDATHAPIFIGPTLSAEE